MPFIYFNILQARIKEERAESSLQHHKQGNAQLVQECMILVRQHCRAQSMQLLVSCLELFERIG